MKKLRAHLFSYLFYPLCAACLCAMLRIGGLAESVKTPTERPTKTLYDMQSEHSLFSVCFAVSVFLCRLKDDLVNFVTGTPPPKDKSQYISPNNDRTKLQNIQTRKLNVKKPKISRLVSCTMKKHKKTFATWCESRSRTMEQN